MIGYNDDYHCCKVTSVIWIHFQAIAGDNFITFKKWNVSKHTTDKSWRLSGEIVFFKILSPPTFLSCMTSCNQRFVFFVRQQRRVLVMNFDFIFHSSCSWFTFFTFSVLTVHNHCFYVHKNYNLHNNKLCCALRRSRLKAMTSFYGARLIKLNAPWTLSRRSKVINKEKKHEI